MTPPSNLIEDIFQTINDPFSSCSIPIVYIYIISEWNNKGEETKRGSKTDTMVIQSDGYSPPEGRYQFQGLSQTHDKMSVIVSGI
jgi:hypothetical protein